MSGESKQIKFKKSAQLLLGTKLTTECQLGYTHGVYFEIPHNDRPSSQITIQIFDIIVKILEYFYSFFLLEFISENDPNFIETSNFCCNLQNCTKFGLLHLTIRSLSMHIFIKNQINLSKFFFQKKKSNIKRKKY